MTGKVTLYDVIDSHIKRYDNNLYTALPAIVDSYDPSNQTVDCSPTLDLETNQGQRLPYPILKNVQVVFPSGGGGLLSFPVKKGDTVLLVFSKNSLDLWKDGDGGSVKLDSKRSHSIADAVAIVGLYTTKTHLEPNPEDVELKFNGNKLVLKEDGSVEIKSESSIKISNNSVELIDILGQIVDEITKITTNTMYGASPINNIPALIALKSQLDTLKG